MTVDRVIWRCVSWKAVSWLFMSPAVQRGLMARRDGARSCRSSGDLRVSRGALRHAQQDAFGNSRSSAFPESLNVGIWFSNPPYTSVNPENRALTLAVEIIFGQYTEYLLNSGLLVFSKSCRVGNLVFLLPLLPSRWLSKSVLQERRPQSSPGTQCRSGYFS